MNVPFNRGYLRLDDVKPKTILVDMSVQRFDSYLDSASLFYEGQ